MKCVYSPTCIKMKYNCDGRFQDCKRYEELRDAGIRRDLSKRLENERLVIKRIQ